MSKLTISMNQQSVDVIAADQVNVAALTNEWFVVEGVSKEGERVRFALPREIFARMLSQSGMLYAKTRRVPTPPEPSTAPEPAAPTIPAIRDVEIRRGEGDEDDLFIIHGDNGGKRAFRLPKEADGDDFTLQSLSRLAFLEIAADRSKAN